jgi:ATP phosphoribosyltransferase regulatory subunit
VGIGDAALYPALLETFAVPPQARETLLRDLVDRDFVGLERELGRLDLPVQARETLATVPSVRGGVEVLDGRPATESLRRVYDLLEPAVARRALFDLGLTRDLGYYTGAVFEVYDPALGEPLGGGGRYDELLGRFGRPLPAVGFALGVDKLHIALAGEERGP